MICYKCKNSYEGEIFRTTECPVCGADMHVCKNCRFYDTGAHYECRETVDEAVSDKEKANFCDAFMKKTGEGQSCGKEAAGGKAAVDAFNALFGD